jgi:acid phosphatase family membrane protein YuiD
MENIDIFLDGVFSNKVLAVAFVSWATAQILKVIINFIVNGKFSLERLIGDGGMPSAHSATVTAAALSTGCECGFDSPLFAVAAIFAFIVMHDAKGVRYETGKQAKVLNEMMELFKNMGDAKLSNEQKLKEFVGHSPLQVFAGFILGSVITAILYSM